MRETPRTARRGREEITMKLTAEKILHRIWDDMEFEAYGLRADRSGLEIGTKLENSRQWFQDWQDHWGEFPADDYNADPEHPYNEDMGCWDDGELDGVCTIRIDKYASTVQDIETALNRIEAYIDDVRTEIYLIGGSYSQGGYDIGESIISDAIIIA